MNLLLFIILGIIIALAADALDSKKVFGGISVAIMTGAVGALLGGLTANLLLGQQILSANVATLLLASLASLMVILVHRTVGVRS